MASYPVVADYATSYTTGLTTHDVLMPATVAAGNLLLVFIYSDGLADDDSMPVGWTRIAYDSSGEQSCGIFTKTADGTEDGTNVTATTASAEATAHIALAISGWSGVEISSVATGDSGSFDPPSLTPAGGSADYLWVAVAGCDGGGFDHVPTGYPSGYDSNQYYVRYASTSGSMTCCATKNATAASDNPGAFTIDSTDTWAAWTIAVKGAAAATNIIMNII